MKGIWNRLRLALLGGILAFAGAGMISPLAGGVVAEAASSDWVGKAFEKIDAVGDLQDGDAILLARGSSFLGEFNSKNYFVGVEGTSGKEIVYNGSFEVFLLDGANGKFTLECDALKDGYYLTQTDDSNNVYVTNSVSSADKWTFSIVSGYFRLQSSSYSNRYLQHNASTNPNRFACYKTSSNQQDLEVYRFRPIVSYDEIRAVGSLEKTEYMEGDSFDSTGIEIHGYIGNVDQGAIPLSNITWEPSVLHAGVTAVEAVYVNGDGSQLRCTIEGITVTAREATGIEVVVATELTYAPGDTRDYEGVSVKALYADGSSTDVTEAATFDPAKGTIVGSNEEGKTIEVTVTYLTFSKTFNYSVPVVPILDYSAVSSDFGKTGDYKSSVLMGDLAWTFTYSCKDNGYLSTDQNKGVQLGSKNNPFYEFYLRSPLLIGAGKSLITEITVNASIGSYGTSKLSVYVGGESVGSNVLTEDATDYTYVIDEGKVGHVEIAITPSSGTSLSRAVYLKSITIKGSSVTGTGDDDAIAALTKLEAVDGCAYSTPEEISNLESIVDEYDSLCADYPTFAAAMLDDYESGDASHANGIQKDYVAAGEKAESIRGRITAPEAQPFFSFQGEGGDRMNWAIAGASLGIALLGAAGYLFYRKKRAVR